MGDVQSDVWAWVAAQRLELAEALADLRSDEWDAASLCDGWRARDVLAHLVWLAEGDRPRVLTQTALGALRHRCSPLTAMVPIARSLADQVPPATLLSRLRAASGGRFVPPGAPPGVALAEALVHGLDITRPLGRPDGTQPERARIAVVALRRFAPVYATPAAARRLRLTSTSDWSVPGLGGGELVASDGDLLLVAAGRLDPTMLTDVGSSPG